MYVGRTYMLLMFFGLTFILQENQLFERLNKIYRSPMLERLKGLDNLTNR